MQTVTTAPHRVSLRPISSSLQERPSALAVDLVSIAAHIYAVDRSMPRGRSWKRCLHARADVADANPWAARRSELASALTVLTDDAWEIDIVEGRTVLPEESQAWLLKVRENRITAVALFSGGLDSFAGAASWLNEHPDEVLGLLSVCSSSVVGKIQRDLAQMLSSAYPSRVFHLTVPLNLVHAPDVERSQRSRGFVCTAFATAAAHCAGTARVLIFENGYGSINPRLVEHQEGAQATKSTHPFAIRLLEEVYQAAGFGVRIELPHSSHTKAELLARVPEDLRPGIRMTASCDSFPLRRRDAKQCGYCGSCILRQQALRFVGFEDFDRKDYAEPAFENVKRSKYLLLMAYQARQFIEVVANETPADAARRWPEIALGDEGQPSLSQIERLDMLHRYGLEWKTLVARDPALGARMGWKVVS